MSDTTEIRSVESHMVIRDTVFPAVDEWTEQQLRVWSAERVLACFGFKASEFFDRADSLATYIRTGEHPQIGLGDE